MKSDYLRAINEYEALLSHGRNNKDVMAWYRLGVSYYHLADYQKAIEYLNKSLLQEANASQQQLIYSSLARSYMRSNNDSAAILSLEKSVANGYMNFPELDSAIEFAPLHHNEKFKELVARSKQNAFPCMYDAHYREFDFWVGEWNAYITGTNTLAGHSIIQKASGDCMILENWTSARVPFNGKSMNFIDPKTNKWEQIWVGSNGKTDQVGRFFNGEYKDSVMRFEFEIMDEKNKKLAGRFSFFNEGPQQVRQLNETSADSGKTWIVVYDLTYRRVN